MNNKVLIGMSGGVDSSVTAYILKEKGYNCIGVTMRTWGEDSNSAFEHEAADAKAVCYRLGIPHFIKDCRDIFKKEVMDYFVYEYKRGRTPNPCMVCNRKIKWEVLLAAADEMDAEYVATGHYAFIKELPNKRLSVSNASQGKDQSYVLFNLTQEQLRRTIMPLGEYSKDQIRKIASDIGIEVADKPDSQDICFIPDGDYVKFLSQYADYRPKPGNFIYEDGTVIGTHKGIVNYTIGQRKGLNLSMGHPVFVTAIRSESNEVVIGSNEDLHKNNLIVEAVNYMGMPEPEVGVVVSGIGKIRYAHKGSSCRLLKREDGMIEVTFDEPVRAITPGQGFVFYDNTENMNILCGGIIHA